jgi:hypothetical protein
MKNLFCILLLITNLLSAQTYKAKLIDFNSEKIPAYCGYRIAYGVLKFEMQEDAKNFKKGEVIFVVQKCPREQMLDIAKTEMYENNKVYNLSIGNEADKEFTKIGFEVCETNYPKDKPIKFWFGHIEK